MLLKDLLKDVRVLSADDKLLQKDICDVKINHHQVERGDVFIALKGINHNGNDFAEEALKNGAECIISEEKLPFENVVQVENSRGAYAVISKHFFSDCCNKLKLIAVTGTNGKTTTVNTIASLLRTAGANVGVIGTLGASFNEKNIDTGFTTPDPYILHKLLLKMYNEGVEFVIMEVSAHALALNKLDGIKFEIGVLTNITEDHLDFFEDMDNYSKAKFKLFSDDMTKLGIIIGGKDFDDNLLMLAQVPLITYGIGDSFDVCGKNIIKSFDRSEFVCDYMGEIFDIKTPLIGGYNIENALAALAVCRSLGVDEKLLQLGMNCLVPVEGRFNVIKINGKNIIIDFAHTPDGLEKVLQTAKELTSGKLTVVFGCGGNRDKQKRPIMGYIASKIADEVVLTSDNPRNENAYDIINQIKQGVIGECQIEVDRKKAIEKTLAKLKPGETVVIAGKGGEKYQEINGEKIPYSDFDEVYNFFRKNIKAIDNLNKNDEKSDKNDKNNDFCNENDIK